MAKLGAALQRRLLPAAAEGAGAAQPNPGHAWTTGAGEDLGAKNEVIQ